MWAVRVCLAVASLLVSCSLQDDEAAIGRDDIEAGGESDAAGAWDGLNRRAEGDGSDRSGIPSDDDVSSGRGSQDRASDWFWSPSCSCEPVAATTQTVTSKALASPSYSPCYEAITSCRYIVPGGLDVVDACTSPFVPADGGTLTVTDAKGRSSTLSHISQGLIAGLDSPDHRLAVQCYAPVVGPSCDSVLGALQAAPVTELPASRDAIVAQIAEAAASGGLVDADHPSVSWAPAVATLGLPLPDAHARIESDEYETSLEVTRGTGARRTYLVWLDDVDVPVGAVLSIGFQGRLSISTHQYYQLAGPLVGRVVLGVLAFGECRDRSAFVSCVPAGLDEGISWSWRLPLPTESCVL